MSCGRGCPGSVTVPPDGQLVDFLAVDFFAVVFVAGLDVFFAAEVFLGVDVFFAVLDAFFAEDFFAEDFFAADFVAADRVAVDVFLPVDGVSVAACGELERCGEMPATFAAVSTTCATVPAAALATAGAASGSVAGLAT